MNIFETTLAFRCGPNVFVNSGNIEHKEVSLWESMVLTVNTGDDVTDEHKEVVVEEKKHCQKEEKVSYPVRLFHLHRVHLGDASCEISRFFPLWPHIWRRSRCCCRCCCWVEVAAVALSRPTTTKFSILETVLEKVEQEAQCSIFQTSDNNMGWSNLKLKFIQSTMTLAVTNERGSKWISSVHVTR